MDELQRHQTYRPISVIVSGSRRGQQGNGRGQHGLGNRQRGLGDRQRGLDDRQRGLGLVSLIVFAAVLVFAALITMKVFPTVTEYFAVKKAVAKAAQEGGSTIQAVRNAFDRAATIDDIHSITGKDLDVSKNDGGHIVVAFKYEKKLELFGPASLLLEYQGSATEGSTR